MREYFNDILNNLDTLAGLRQLENIYRSVGDDRGKAITEINKLLDALCNVSKLFPFIPEADQQKIINQAVITTPKEEFPNLNANLVYKWLNRHKDKFFKESHHIPEQPEAPPLTGEEKQKWIDKWKVELAKFGQPVADATEQEMSQAKRKERGNLEWLRGHTTTGYRPPIAAEVIAHDLHIQYIKENYDPYTGKPKEGWISEIEWLKSKGDIKK